MQVRLLAALEGVGLAYRKMGDDPEKVCVLCTLDLG